jgi:hypothetical protein
MYVPPLPSASLTARPRRPQWRDGSGLHDYNRPLPLRPRRSSCTSPRSDRRCRGGSSPTTANIDSKHLRRLILPIMPTAPPKLSTNSSSTFSLQQPRRWHPELPRLRRFSG